ncbi:MAG TPA: DNA polymerase domain-containing protein [Nitrososphaerales archaeon]|nr:DNA polymerase domain-containing protein [Nitrososphaerales archaeon]
MRGWILDLYPGAPGEMVVWLRLENGEAVRLVDRWSPSMFVGTDNKADFAVPLHTVKEEFEWARTVQRRERVTDPGTSEVLEMKLKDATKAQQVAGRIERLGPFGTFRLYNADVPPAQSYLYEKDLFPLARCEVEERNGGLQWKLEDDVWDYEYAAPGLRKVGLEVEVAKEGKLPRFTDRLKAVTLESDNGKIAVDGASEAGKLLGLVRAIEETDPDIILTSDGDTFLFPYLVKRAEANGLASRLVLDRDRTVMKLPSKGGTSYFSYGRIHYKPSAIKLRGRVHIDINTSFAYSEAGFEGLFELSRICRMPLHTSSRASIGKALSSLQFYHAHRTGLLVPWKPTLAERFKDRNELLMADRGGFIFEPRVGVYENVGELDFSALYPNIMYRKNISAETVRCSCCPDSDNRVPELDWNVCRRATGIVPLAIKIIVEKRLRYKELKAGAANEADRQRYNSRQAALKWLGVTTFGYLGFNNAKFGRIDAHIAVCAWDRKVLLDTARIAEGRGFEVIHGIVDSLWVRRGGATRGDYMELKREIESKTGFAMTFEGVYKWVAFLSSKAEPGVPVLNRYFGAYQDGSLKVRGVEARRHDTPLAFARCQMEILKIMAQADSVSGVRARVPDCVEAFLGCADSLRRHEVPASELAYTTNLSKAPDEYTTMTVQHAAITQLTREGASLHAGEGIRYVIADYKGRDSKRAIPLDMVEDQAKYDAGRYIRLLAEACSSVLEPFDPGCDALGLTRAYEARMSGPLTS